MDFLAHVKPALLALFVASLSGCSTLDIQPWSSEEIIDGVISSALTGRKTAYGNQATCNHYKMVGGSSYREWKQDGEIACSYKP